MRTKEEIAIDRIHTFKPDALGFSGGKDSVVCDELMRRSGVPYTAWMNLTTVDPKIHVDFVRQNFPHVVFVHPEKGVSMYSLIKRWGFPSRKHRYCCQELKERVQLGNFVVFGVRQAESIKRRNKPMFHYHPKHPRLKVLNLIIDWTDQDVWRYINANHLPVSPLYQAPYNLKRVGCVGCPMDSRVGRQFRLFPEYRRYYINAIRAYMLSGNMKSEKLKRFETPEQMFEWWVSKVSTSRFLAQMSFCMDN